MSADADAICPQCGRIHIVKEAVSIRDRVHGKWIDNYQKIFYVADNLFAYDRADKSSGALQHGLIAGLSHAGLVGLAVGVAAGTVIDVAQEAAKKSKQAKKVVSTAVCYDWGSVASLIYPIEPFKVMLANIEAGRGIDVKLRDGTGYTLVFGYNSETVKEIYEKMNELHQKSIARNPTAQIGYANQRESSFAGKEFTQEPVQQPVSPVNQNNQASTVKISHGHAAPNFFKCSYCGITQMREGNFCAYCGKPAPVLEPAPEEKSASLSGQLTCPSCRNIQEAGSKFCSKCGQKMAAEQPRIVFCLNCGAKVSEGMSFCMECGSKLK